MKCYNCGTKYFGSSCPNCGAQKLAVSHKKHGFGFYLFFGFVGYVVLTGVISSFSHTDDKTTGANKASEAPIVYKVCDISEMLNELDDNALKAERKYTDQYIEITGKLNVIDSDGKYISVAPTDGDFLFDDIQCYIKTEVQADKILDMHRGDPITIKGQIKEIGEIIGYSLNIDLIE